MPQSSHQIGWLNHLDHFTFHYQLGCLSLSPLEVREKNLLRLQLKADLIRPYIPRKRDCNSATLWGIVKNLILVIAQGKEELWISINTDEKKDFCNNSAEWKESKNFPWESQCRNRTAYSELMPQFAAHLQKGLEKKHFF